MKRNHSIRRSLITSVISLILCVSMLAGTTFAWFTDSVSSGRNLITAGNLDVVLLHADKATNGVYEEVDGSTVLFDDVDSDNWEPGAMAWEKFTVKNVGDLALKYQFALKVLSASEVEGISFASVLKAAVVDSDFEYTRENVMSIPADHWKNIDSVDLINSVVPLLENESDTFGIVIWWQPSDIDNVFNMNNGKTGEVKLEVGVVLNATQAESEKDSFGSDYDANIQWPNTPAIGNSASKDVEVNNAGEVAAATTIEGEGMSADVPAGVKMANGANKLTLSVNSVEESGANVTVASDESVRSLDVHVEGIAKDNTVPMSITIIEAMPVGLNLGNFTIYHVENGQTVAMTRLEDGDAIVHNSYSYDPATGNIILHLASFSEIALVSNTENAWNGKVDKDLAGQGTESNPYIIATADELAGMSQLVSTDKHYASACYKLYSNINFGGYENYWVDGIIDGKQIKENVFYPIGYWAPQEGTNAAGEVYYDYGNGFSGIFDGNGYTISGICQRTWDMDGNYDNGYWDAAMGLFGYVNGGTVKNLTIRDFESDGEFTPTGCVAAYARAATFENIALVNCNPRVYNTGNGGIVGILGLNDDENIEANKTTFKNITVDNTNTISALWGTWDGCCGGIAGMYRGRGPVYLENCHVGAKIDVYNDVCGNYQYYWYRYSGMLIAAIRTETTDQNGYTIPDTSTITAKNCTVHFGDWNDYYYCELVANSLASYTHDHQFSRLTEIASLSEIKNGNTWTKTGNFLLVEGENKTCYHIVKDANGNLVEHKHEDAGTETVNGKTVLKEDNQIVHLPFNQIFQGWGWGVKNIPVYNGENYAFEGVTILDRDQANSVEKFEGRKLNREVDENGTVIREGLLTSPISGRRYKLSHIFNKLEGCGVPVITGALTVTVTNLDEDGDVSVTLTRSTKGWEDCELVFSGGGKIRLTIQDYYYCTPTSIEIVVRNYPEGSRIRNFTYDGFYDGEGYEFSTTADHITSGKHGTYEYDFGFGPEILDYSHKIDSKAEIVFVPENNGSIIIAYASKNAGATLKVNGEVVSQINKEYELQVVYIEAAKGRAYHITRGTLESALYYVAFLPNTVTSEKHTHAYFTEYMATCTESGDTIYTCLVCGDKYTEHREKLGHNWVYEPGYDETCTNHGKEEGEYCSRCDEIKWGCKSIDPHPHKYDEYGFCHCESESCHMPKEGTVKNVIAGVDFTTGKADDYSKYGTNGFFKPVGNCEMSNNKNFLIMKTTAEGQNSYIEFTVDKPVTFYVRVSSTDRENVSKFVLEDAAGNQIKSVFHDLHHGEHSTPVVEVTGVSGHTLIYTIPAGTYRFYCTSTDRVGRVMNMVVSTDVIDVSK